MAPAVNLRFASPWLKSTVGVEMLKEDSDGLVVSDILNNRYVFK